MTIVKEVNAPPTNPRHRWYDVQYWENGRIRYKMLPPECLCYPPDEQSQQ